MRLLIREKREAAGLSQQEFAKRVFVRQSVVSNWEHGTALPRTAMLPAIAKALGCTVDELYPEEERQNASQKR